jgi:PilZ domain
LEYKAQESFHPTDERFVPSRGEEIVAASGKPTRKSMRYPVEAPVLFWWKDENGSERRGEGTSRDVSETGTFVFTPGCPQAGANVALRIFVVAPLDATRVLNLAFEGRVLRVEQTTPGGGKSGFAVLSLVANLHEYGERAGNGEHGGNERLTSDE